MSHLESAKGSCLCGSVSMSTSSMKNELGACHCGMCRKWGGGPFMEVNCGSDVQIEGEEFVQVYNSSDWAERGFCKKCGTHLFYRLKHNQEHMVPAGFFGDSISPKFSMQVFIDKKPEFYNFTEKTEVLTEQQIFDMYAPKE